MQKNHMASWKCTTLDSETANRKEALVGSCVVPMLSFYFYYYGIIQNNEIIIWIFNLLKWDHEAALNGVRPLACQGQSCLLWWAVALLRSLTSPTT